MKVFMNTTHKKYVEVRSCTSCPNRGISFTFNYYFCTKNNRQVSYPANEIPEWCPLEDIEQLYERVKNECK